MKAIVCERYGPPDVLEFKEVDKPAPKANELLIKVRAASLNAFDWHMLLPDPFLVRLTGGVGTFALQLAKFFGAEVSAGCSTGNTGMARLLGADQVIDYCKEDFTKSGKQYDLILAANGYHRLADYKRALAPGGTYVMTGGSMRQIFQAMFLAPWFSMSGNKKMGGIVAQANQKDLVFIKELMEDGKVVPVIDRVYPLAEVAEALRYLVAGHARGKVVIKVTGGSA
jgi:NADPH:quinone reductase-like Zn-dependent oxidoreductase